MKELRDAVTFAMDLLVKLPKLKPKELDKEDEGIDALKSAMSDPALVVERLRDVPAFQQALRAIGWLPPPPKPSNRPTRAQTVERAEYKDRLRDVEADEEAEDDNVLRGMLDKVGATP